MAQIDLKNAVVRLCDGRLAAVTTTAVAGVNAQLTLTDKSKHRGTRTPVSITIVVAGLSTALSVSVLGSAITVNSATDGGGLATTTAAQAKAAIEAFTAANALVTVTLPGTGASVISAQALTSLLSGARTLEIRIGEGTLRWSETQNREYTMSRGLLDTVRDGDQAPVEVNLDSIFEFYKASTGSGAPTPIEVLKQTGEASVWLTTATDTCEPYCIDIEVFHDTPCAAVEDEILMFETFRHEKVDADIRAGTFVISGKCNRVAPLSYRQA